MKTIKISVGLLIISTLILSIVAWRQNSELSNVRAHEASLYLKNLKLEHFKDSTLNAQATEAKSKADADSIKTALGLEGDEFKSTVVLSSKETSRYLDIWQRYFDSALLSKSDHYTEQTWDNHDSLVGFYLQKPISINDTTYSVILGREKGDIRHRIGFSTYYKDGYIKTTAFGIAKNTGILKTEFTYEDERDHVITYDFNQQNVKDEFAKLVKDILPKVVKFKKKK
jgi:hypothetical protein